MHCAGIGYCIENAQSVIIRPGSSFNFQSLEFFFKKSVEDKSFAVKRVFL